VLDHIARHNSDAIAVSFPPLMRNLITFPSSRRAGFFSSLRASLMMDSA
jgi:hypothetical protein